MGRVRGLGPPLAAGAAAGLAALALHLRDPHVRGSWGFCPTALIGFDCPACGSLRAVHHLTNLDLVAAASSNLLLVLLLPVVVGLWVRRLVLGWRGGPGDPIRPPRWVWITGLALVAVFTVLRNLPMGAWLHS